MIGWYVWWVKVKVVVEIGFSAVLALVLPE
jgi:hypothetical protein